MLCATRRWISSVLFYFVVKRECPKVTIFHRCETTSANRPPWRGRWARRTSRALAARRAAWTRHSLWRGRRRSSRLCSARPYRIGPLSSRGDQTATHICIILQQQQQQQKQTNCFNLKKRNNSKNKSYFQTPSNDACERVASSRSPCRRTFSISALDILCTFCVCVYHIWMIL